MEAMYAVSFEISGPLAMFARPDTGSCPVSYPVPTRSAAKGMFDAVARLPGGRDAPQIIPQRVEVCSEIRYERYVTNYGGPLRTRDAVNAGNNYQLIATVLSDVCYRLYGVVDGGTPRSRHQLQSMFERRLENGQSYYTPCLGWKEFAPNYFGQFRDTTDVNVTLSERIATLLDSVFDDSGRVAPLFTPDAHIRGGVLVYERSARHAE